MKKSFALRLALLLASSAMLFTACEPSTTDPDDPDVPVVPDVPDPDPQPDPDPDPITPDPESVTFAEIIEAGCSGEYEVNSVVVVAVGAHNTVVSDGTAYMLLYDPDKTSSVGDEVSLSGSVTEFNGVPEWDQPTITKNATRESVPYPDPIEITESYLKSYSSSPVIVYGVAEGSKSGYKISVGGQTLYSYSNETISDGDIKVYGFTIGYASKYKNVNFVITSVSATDPQPDPDPEPEPDPDPDPDPDPVDPGTPSTGKYSWVELPVMYDENSDGRDDNDNTLYYATHFTDLKSPTGDAARNYTVCYSGDHHCPVWVAAPRHEMYQTKNVNRTNAYGQDPDIPSDIQYYSKSTGGGCNKGHMLGSAERLASTKTNQQVFYYTNIAPQLSSGFNTGGGGWNILEDWVDGQVCSDTLYVVIGCYFEKYTDGYGNTVSPKTISFGGRDDVDMPTMFYYALLRTKKGSTGKALKDCSASEMKCVAFVRSHTNDLKGQKPSSKEMMSISDLEKVTGFKYFTNVPNAPKESFNASDWDL